MSHLLSNFDIVSLVGVFGTGAPANAVKALSVFVAALGAFFLLCAFMPATIETFKSKNVVGVNKLMFFLHFCVATFFSIGSIAMIISNSASMANSGNATIDLPILGVIFTGCNLPSMCGCGYIVWLKHTSAKQAQALGLSEAEYYRQHTAKTLATQPAAE